MNSLSLANISPSPQQQGSVDLIVCRPKINERRVLEHAELSIEQGLIGDNWSKAECNTGHYQNYANAQISLMNSQVMMAIQNDKSRWPAAGDNFFVDFELSTNNIPPGTQLGIGAAIIEITEEPHLPCKKFKQRFGEHAFSLLNSTEGREANLRGVYARVISAGHVSSDSMIRKLEA
jgi:MOSC domain-containing protein YiiM